MVSGERDIGRLEGGMSALERRHEDFERRVEERLSKIEDSVQKILDAANMGKGAWWIMLKIGAMITTITLSLAWIYERVAGTWRP